MKEPANQLLQLDLCVLDAIAGEADLLEVVGM
jgi:hypothetical protein